MLDADKSGVKADTVILNNTPYSLQRPAVEGLIIGQVQQSIPAREKTLRNIIAGYMTVNPAVEPIFSKLKEESGVVGPSWAPDANTERDNRGKVYLYFSPDDGTVGLPNIEGIGCWGVDEKQMEKLGKRFFQRMFASPVGSNPSAPDIGTEPKKIKVHYNRNIIPTFDKELMINAEILPVPFKPEFGKAMLPNGPIDASIAVTSPYTGKLEKLGIRPGETPDEAQARWLNSPDTNSFHSSIVSNPMHSRMATAYDLCIGASGILIGNDLKWMEFLRAAADWRTNWSGSSSSLSEGDPSFPAPKIEIFEILKEINEIDRFIIFECHNYYNVNSKKPGILPEFTSACKINELPAIVSIDSIPVNQEGGG